MLESELQMDFPSENEQPEENIINEEGGEEYGKNLNLSFSTRGTENLPVLLPNVYPTISTSAWKSATLLKITQSRISDMRELVDRRNRVKHEDDIW